jgi:hypothetical protein
MAQTVAQRSTELLRSSPEPTYARLRELLPAIGLDPTRDVLADLFPDDVDQEFGVVVTTEHKVFIFVLHYGRSGDLKQQAADAVIGDWSDITGWWQASPYVAQVNEALELLGD